jgi:hypothetical protein
MSGEPVFFGIVGDHDPKPTADHVYVAWLMWLVLAPSI